MASGDPVAGRPGLVAEFARQLNELRHQARLTYQQLADRSRGEVSRSTLCRAASGKTLPRWRTVACFVKACDGDEEHWRGQHRAARYALDTGETVGLVFSPSPVPTAAVPRRLPTVREAIANSAVRSFDRALQGVVKAVDDPLIGSIRVRGGRLAEHVGMLYKLWLILNSHRNPIRTTEAFTDCLREIKERSGLSFQQISHRTAVQPVSRESSHVAADAVKQRPVSVSALSDLCNPSQGRLPSKATLDRFLAALGYSEAERLSMEELRSELASRFDRRLNRRPRRDQTGSSQSSTPSSPRRPVFGGYIEMEENPLASFEHFRRPPFS